MTVLLQCHILTCFLITSSWVIFWFTNIIFSRKCYILFWILCWRLWIILFFLIDQICDLFLRAFKKPINLTLSMLFYRIISSLNSRRIDWCVSGRTLITFWSSGNYNSWLRSRRPATRCSNFSLISFLCLFHIFTLNNIIFYIIWFLTSSPLLFRINSNIEFIKLIQTFRFISSSIIMIALCSPFGLLWIYKLMCKISHIQISIWIIILWLLSLSSSLWILKTLLRLLRFILIWSLSTKIWVS